MKDRLFTCWLLGMMFILPSRELIGQELRLVAQLPTVVAETSGIEVTDANEIWTFNDSGGDPVLYLCDTSGNLVRSLRVLGAHNNDWEDIAQDDIGNFYIADIGNNENDRRDLRIYKIPAPDTFLEDSVLAEIIEFAYEDQRSFPPASDSLNFDGESLFWMAGHLYMCSKNRTSPFDGLTFLYRIPDDPGTYIAEKIGAFDTQGGAALNSWITGADLSPGGRLCLLSSDKMWIFYDFNEDHFFDGSNVEINLGTISQKEAICFVNESNIYITDEELIAGIGRNLYSIEIGELLTGTRELATSLPRLSIFPNPCKDIVNFRGDLTQYEIELFDVCGHKIKLLSRWKDHATIDLHRFPNSIYFVQVLDRATGDFWVHKVVKME